MILFLEDWKKYPSAIVDYQTKNKSFLDIAMLFRDMGIKNHLFPLALINPQIRGLDPHSPNLTHEQIKLITAECKINPWYFLREVLRAPARSGADSVPVTANRGNICLWWCFLNHITIFLTQPRQTGKSFNTDGIMTWLLQAATMNTEINLLTKDDTLRRSNIDRIKEIMDLLPPYLDSRTRKDTNNGENITVNALGNIYKTHVPQASPKGANKIGRGLTTAILHIDEAPFQPNIDIAISAAIPAMTAAVEQAKKNNAPYGIIYTTTAGRKDEKEGKYIYNLVSRAATWHEKFYDCEDNADLVEQVKGEAESGNPEVYAVFNHTQLGYDDTWLEDVLSRLPIVSPADMIRANMDFFNIWSSGTESSPFDPAVARAISLNKRNPDHKRFEDIGSLITKWYIPQELIPSYMNSKRTVLGLDTSDAVGKDDIGFVLTDVETLNVVCTGKFNHINLFEFSRFIAEFLMKYPNVTAIIERKSSGTYILDYLLINLYEMGINPFERLFNLVVQEATDQPDRFMEVKGKGGFQNSVIEKYKGLFGYSTSGSGNYTRNALYGNNFQVALERAHDRLFDEDLSNQLLALKIKNNRIDHDTGGHDDMVIAWLLTHWFLSYGKNLKQYGIDSNTIYQAGNVVNKVMTDEEIRQFEEQNNIKHRMVALYEELENEQNEWLSYKIEQELRTLSRKLILTENTIFSIDQLIKTAQENKKRKFQERNMLDNMSNYSRLSGEYHRHHYGNQHYGNRPYGYRY